jgi:putative transposase
VSRSCFYEFKYHVPSDRQIRRLLLSGPVADIHKRSWGTYGMLRIRAALLREQDMVVNKKLILSIMRELGIKGLSGPKKHKKNLVHQATKEDLVQRNFTVDAPRAVAHRHHRAPDAGGQGLLLRGARRLPPPCGGLGHRPALRDRTRQRRRHDGERVTTHRATSIIHSDHGSQFTSWEFSELIRTKGLLGSMGTVGDCYDHTLMESFWGSMQIELLNHKKGRTKIELSIAMAEWIEHFYNPERLHSSLGYVPPIEFEASYAASIQICSIHPGLTPSSKDRKTGSRSNSLREHRKAMCQDNARADVEPGHAPQGMLWYSQTNPRPDAAAVISEVLEVPLSIVPG